MKKRIISFLTCICMVLSGAAALPSGTLTKLFSFSASAEVASGTCGDNINWTLDENGKLTISGTGDIYRYATNNPSPFYKNLSIRSLVIEEGVTSLSYCMFFGCTNLEKVSIASTVTSIAYGVFDMTKWIENQKNESPFVIINGILIDANDCIDEITIPQNVRVIGKFAITTKNVWKVNIPEGVEIIDEYAFYGSGLKAVNIPDSVTTIGPGAFKNCDLWSLTLGKGVKYIYSSAFKGCSKLTDIVIPDSVEYLGYAFHGLNNLYIGSGVKELDAGFIRDVNNVEISEANPYYKAVDGIVYDKQNNTLFSISKEKKHLYFEDGVTKIPDHLSDSNYELEYCIIPETVIEIGQFAFSGCCSLKSISLSSNLRKIASTAFDTCSSLDSIIIPDSVKEIGDSSFRNGGLKSVDFSNNPELSILEPYMFQSCSNLNQIEIPQNINEIEPEAFESCSSLKKVILHEGLEYIGDCTFNKCEKLKSIKIPKSVILIGTHAFGYDYENYYYNDEHIVNETKYSDFTIYCYEGTEGERYAKDNGFKYVLLEECKHEYTVQTVPASCLKFGYDLHTCQKCGETFKDNFTDLLGHSYGNWEVCEEASCIKTGTQQKVCEHCGLTVSKQIDKADHIWGEWTVIEKPSAARLGLKERSCKVCGKIESEVMPKDESVKDIYRLAGKNRYETAANISSVSTPFSDNVVLACGMNYADALAGVPLANALGAPILLTNKDNLPQKTLDEIKRLKAKTVILLGGEGAVGAEVEKTLKNNHLAVERIAGATRFETATRIAEKMQTVSGKASSEVFFVYAFDFADALSASTAAAIKGSPIIYLNTKGELDNTTKRYLESVKGNVKTAYVIGGEGVISDDMMNKAAKALGLSKATRIAGANRFATCVAVNEKFADVLNGDMLCVATGMDFPDALAGGVYAALNKAPLFLINGKLKTPKLSDEQKTYLKTKAANSITAFGGVGVVPDNHIADIAKNSI